MLYCTAQSLKAQSKTEEQVNLECPVENVGKQTSRDLRSSAADSKDGFRECSSVVQLQHK